MRTILLIVATVALALSPFGYITVPGFGQAITLVHIPMILAATLESPFAAAVVGATFGLVTGLKFSTPPLPYHVVARTLAGLTAGVAYQLFSSAAGEDSRVTLASAGTAVVGTLANTLYMSLAVILLGLSQPAAIFSVALVHGIFELIAALVLVVPITIALQRKTA